VTYEIVIRYRHELVTATVAAELPETAVRRAKDLVSREQGWPVSELVVEHGRVRPADSDYEKRGSV
jgi:hypothetical protein